MKVAETAAIQQMWCAHCCSIQPIRMVGACWHCQARGTAGDVRTCRCPAARRLHAVGAKANAALARESEDR